MRLLVFGASGRTGRQIVRQALEQGHEVTAFVRAASAQRLAAVMPPHANLTLTAGDVLDPAVVDQVVAVREGAADGAGYGGADGSYDVVISALGTREGDDWILPQATANICAAMQAHGVPRFICVSTLGVGESRAQLGPTFGVMAVELREMLAEKEAQEQVIRESGLDWIIVRPGALTDGPHRGVYRCVTDPAVTLPRALISRADVADFILKHLAGDEYVRQVVSLAY